jgi:hypothetical protein
MAMAERTPRDIVPTPFSKYLSICLECCLPYLAGQAFFVPLEAALLERPLFESGQAGLHVRQASACYVTDASTATGIYAALACGRKSRISDIR